MAEAQVHLSKFNRRVAQESLLDFASTVRSFAFPGNGVPHRNRHWFIEVIEDTDQRLAGLLGFDLRRTERGLAFNAHTSSFGEVETLVPLGSAAAFAIDLESRYVTHEVVPPHDGAPGVSAGVFREVMTKLAKDHEYRLEAVADKESFYEWVGETSRVRSITITIRRPNPHPGADSFAGYQDALVNQAGGEVAVTTITAPEGESLTPDTPFIHEAVDRMANGAEVQISATGVSDSDRPRSYKQGKAHLWGTFERASDMSKATLIEQVGALLNDLRTAVTRRRSR